MKASIRLLTPGNVLRSAALFAACLAWSGASALAQFRAAERPALPNFDNRAPAAPKPERLSERQVGQSRLAGQLPWAVIDFDPLLDSPAFIRSRDGFLTGPNGQGRAVSSLTAKAIPPGEPFQPIKAFLNEHSTLFGHGAGILDTARVKRDYVDAHNGLHTVAWEQQFEGIPVFQSVLIGHITRNGELTSLSSRFLPDLATAADNGTPGRVGLQSAPPVSAKQAILLAGQNIGAGLTPARILENGGLVDGYLLYKTPEQASVRLVWLPLHRSALRLAWEVLVTKSDTHESFQLVIDAQTGQVHLRQNLTCHISNATYNVYDSYSPSPFGPSLQTPGTFQPPLTNRTLIVTSALDTNASPAGWIPDGSNTTTGNNIDAFLDRNFDEQPDQPRPQGTNRVFDFTLDLTMDPTNYIDASTVQLFWRANWYHDRLYELGFTEAAGNYQDNNFGRGGLGNDHIICFVQSGADVGIADNSMFAPAPDGLNGRCYMFIFTGPTPYRDGSLDQETVTHELTHGTSWRLVGGGMALGSLQGNGMGEGWSDFYSEVLLNPTNASPDAAYGWSGYAFYLIAGSGFDQNYYYGIRRYPYCTDMSKNPLTFKDIDPGQALAHKGVPLSPMFSPFDPRSADEVHNQGEVWCVTLWEMHANLVHKYGWAIGNELTLQLTTDGMKLTPALPNFLQARDAILVADTIDNGGANVTEIWNAFAKRGMGYSATSPDGSTTAGVHEAYDVPIVSSVKVSLDHYQVFGGNGNGIIEFNECNNLNVILTNFGTTSLTGIKATLSTTTPNAAVAQAIVSYPDMPAGATGTNAVPFKISTSPAFVCGTPIEFTLVLNCDQGLGVVQFAVPTGLPGSPLQFDGNMLVPIPSPGSASSAVAVSGINSAVNKVTVSMFVEETYDYYLTLELISPDGTTNLLSANNGFLTSNYGLACSPESQRTTFDDAASESITAGVPPFAGSFRPQQPLVVFSGKSGASVNGVWQLRATDQGQFDLAAIHCWSLFITPTLCADGGGQCPGADMALGMTALPNPMIAGNNLTYSIVVTNLGPSIATNVIVTHLLPANVTLVSASSSQGTYSQQGSVVTFSLGAMVPRATAAMTVVVLPAAEGIAVSTATVSSEQPDFFPDNNSVTLTTPVRPATADLAMGIAAVPNPVLNGGTLTYTVTLANNGPSPATAITVTNVLPFSAPIQSVTVSQGTTTTIGDVVLWSVSRLAMGASAIATITVTPTVEGLITATATAAGQEFDPVTANNTAKVTTTVGPAADLALSLTASPVSVVAGSNVTYTITVTNQGPSTATGVMVNDPLPTLVTVLSTNTTQGTISISNHNLICVLGELTNGAGATITIVAATTTNGTLTTTATVTATQPDANPANNSATVSTIVSAPFVSILPAGAVLIYESGPTNGAIDIGETVTVILRLRNAGNSSTRNLVATLLATTGVAPVPPNTPKSYGVLDPSGQPGTNSFTFTASGPNGATINATLQLQDGTNTYPLVSFPFTLPTSQVFASTHTIIIPNPAAPNPPWPQESGPAQPYPSVITVSNFVGLLGKVTVTLSNLSHTYPGDINALLVAPGGAKTLLMSHTGDKPVTGVDLTFDDSAPGPLPATGVLSPGTWQPTAYSPGPQLGGFPPNAPVGPYPAMLSAFNGVNPNGAWSLYVFDDHSGDAGGITNGWSLALTAISPVNQVADLGLTAVATPNSALAGTMVTYIFTVTNGGPNTATFVSFTNILPAGVTLVSSSPSQGTVLTTPTSVIASLGTLNFGATATVTNVVALTAAPIPPGLTTATLTNTANVAADESDLNPVNNVAAAVITIVRPVADLSLAQAVAPDPVPVGYNLTNTVTIANHGPGTAVNAILTQPLPPGVGFIAASSSSTVGTLTSTASAVTCLLGNLASNATATVTIVLTNSAPGLMTNTVTLGSDSFDPNPTNNSASYVATVVSQSPQIINAGAVLTYESGPINGAIDPGETVTLSLALANIGSLDTVNLQATLLPSGGVISPSGPQFYGALVHGGPAAARSFTFTSAAAPGGATIATLQLQDGTSTYPPLTFTFASVATTHVSSSTTITIPNQGTATPYPATINVSGVTGRVSKATVTLNGLSHSFPHDIDIVLVSPVGTNVLFMSHTGGGHAVTNVNLTFDDAATGTLPNYDPITSGTYKPSNYEGPVALPGTAPSKSYQFALSAFNWSNPNGTWSLYVFDDTAADGGIIVQGWSLDLTTLVTVGPVMDLAVSTAVPATLNLGDTLTNTISVSNLGPDLATGILLTNTVPAGVTFVSASLSQGSVIRVADGRVICNLGSLAAGASATASILTVPFVTGSLVNAVTVAGSEEDLNLANNSAQAKTSVSPSLPASLSGSFSGGLFQLTVTGQPNIVYVVQASTDLTTWVPLSTNSSATGTFTFTDTTAPAPQQRFYRTMRQ
jgi:uncharacterized repeat protein (TIGR01451 family)